MARSAVHGMQRVSCTLTAGRDTRVLAALLMATGEPAEYYTGGRPDDDVIARELAKRFGAA